MTAKPQQATATSQPWLLALALSTPIILLPCTPMYLLPVALLALLGLFMLVGLLRHRQTFNVEDKVLQVLPRCILFIVLPILIASIDAQAAKLSLKTGAWYLLYGLMALAVAILLRAQAAFKQVLIILSVIISIWAFNGVAQIAVGMDMFNNPLVDARGYANSVFANSEQYGYFMGALAAIPLYTLYMLGANRLSHLLLTLLLILAVLLGGVRSGWIMFACALVPYFYLTYIKPAKRPIVPMVVVPTFIAAVIFLIVSSSALVKQQVHMTAHGYADLWRAATSVFGQHVFNGVGVHNFLPAMMQARDALPMGMDASYPHQVWLEIAVSTGVIGLLGLLFIYAAIWRLWRQATPDQQKLALPMLMPLLVLWWPINANHSFYSVQMASLTLFFLAFSLAALTYRGEMK